MTATLGRTEPDGSYHPRGRYQGIAVTRMADLRIIARQSSAMNGLSENSPHRGSGPAVSRGGVRRPHATFEARATSKILVSWKSQSVNLQGQRSLQVRNDYSFGGASCLNSSNQFWTITTSLVLLIGSSGGASFIIRNRVPSREMS